MLGEVVGCAVCPSQTLLDLSCNHISSPGAEGFAGVLGALCVATLLVALA